MVRITAPKNRPKNPLSIKPPIAPKKTTGIGTGAFLPNKIGFRTLSAKSVINNQIVSNVAVVVSETENI